MTRAATGGSREAMRTTQPRLIEEGGPKEGGGYDSYRPSSARAGDPRHATPYANMGERLVPVPTMADSLAKDSDAAGGTKGVRGLGAEHMLAWQFLPRHGLAKYRAFGGMSSYYVKPPRHTYTLSRGGFASGNGSKVWVRSMPGTGTKSIL